MTDTPDSTEGMPTDDCLRLLSKPHRRSVLLSLHDRGDDDDGALPVADAVTGPLTERVEIALYHHHLPRLAEADVIRWDQENGTVTEGPRFDAIEAFVRALDRNRDRLPDDWRPDPDR